MVILKPGLWFLVCGLWLFGNSTGQVPDHVDSETTNQIRETTNQRPQTTNQKPI
jgi:hypothetical protein